ncbi:MAG: hypothetical protein KAY24_10470, partial [Candidatus Eisenbacteria sp.]|nr:hypothetical protein [Candidatus Eisenbacteria bacterium]
TGEIPHGHRHGGDPEPRGWWHWFEHQNLRDDRAEVFASLLPGGTYAYAYAVRATTPGCFFAPPPKVEEMYAPETFGRGQGEIVVVE